ncbi:hypothetical protein AAY473_011512 [Plecturocebus cupreus]
MNNGSRKKITPELALDASQPVDPPEWVYETRTTEVQLVTTGLGAKVASLESGGHQRRLAMSPKRETPYERRREQKHKQEKGDPKSSKEWVRPRAQILASGLLLGRLRQENRLNPGSGGCGELRSRLCTPAWQQSETLSQKKKKKKEYNGNDKV